MTEEPDLEPMVKRPKLFSIKRFAPVGIRGKIFGVYQEPLNTIPVVPDDRIRNANIGATKGWNMENGIKLSKILLKNYKNVRIEDEGLKKGDLNVWIGPNGSGKSNLIRVLRFLKDAVAETAESQGVNEFEQAIVELGDKNILDRNIDLPGAVGIGFEFEKSPSFPGGLRFSLELLVKSTGTPSVKREVFCEASPRTDQKEGPFCYYKAHDVESGSAVVSAYRENGSSTRLEGLTDAPTNRLTLNAIPRLLENSEYPPESTPIYKVRRKVVESISRWQFYNANDMNLKEIREAEPKIGPPEEYLSSSGRNLAVVFDNLNQKHVDFEDKINACMKSILPATKKIRAVRAGRLRLTIEWHMEGVTEPFYLDDMSDGSVRMLCWAVVLNSPEPPPLVVIDEPELGLHPAWLSPLAEWLKSASERTQIVVTTHSPDLLDRFTDRLEDVTCLQYDGSAHFFPKRLSREALREKLEEGWELGDLYRVGDPDIGGWPW